MFAVHIATGSTEYEVSRVVLCLPEAAIAEHSTHGIQYVASYIAPVSSRLRGGPALPGKLVTFVGYAGAQGITEYGMTVAESINDASTVTALNKPDLLFMGGCLFRVEVGS